MTDQLTLSHINMNAVLGLLPELCRMDAASAQLLLGQKPLTLLLTVKGGPSMRWHFMSGGCVKAPGDGPADISFRFRSPKDFNAMLAGERDALPRQGLLHQRFIKRILTGLTDRLAIYLLPRSDIPAEEDFIATSLALRFYTHGLALAEIAKHDAEGRAVMAAAPKGALLLAIENGPAITLRLDGEDPTATVQAEAEPDIDGKLLFHGLEEAGSWLAEDMAIDENDAPLMRTLAGLHNIARQYLWAKEK